MIRLKQISGQQIDLLESPLFKQHWIKPNSFAQYILDNEINPGLWHDDLLENLPENAVIVDLGMNVGMFTLYMNKPLRTFYCAEPSEPHIQIAEELFQKFNVTAQVFQGAIYNMNGSVRLFEDVNNTTMNHVDQTGWLVRSSTLKTFFEKFGLNQVDLLKLDVEGAERAILLEDPTVHEALNKCKIVFVETHPQSPRELMEEQIIGKMQGLGFKHKRGKREHSFYFFKQ